MIAIADRFPHGTYAAWAGASGAAQGLSRTAPLPSPVAGEVDRSFAGSAVVDVALLALIENFEQGVAVVDKPGHAHFLNRAAHAHIRAGLLRVEGGCLRGATLGDGVALRRAIDECVAGSRGSSARLVSERGTLLVAACAVPAAAGSIATCAVLLRFTNPAAARLADRDVLQGQFGFTPAEAALAVDILGGHDLAASAARRGITPHTARAHLRRIFEKTGTRRQAELMRLLLLCPQPISAQ